MTVHICISDAQQTSMWNSHCITNSVPYTVLILLEFCKRFRTTFNTLQKRTYLNLGVISGCLPYYVHAAIFINKRLDCIHLVTRSIFHLYKADSKMGLEAQQRFSTGYIQCMHEVHNLLLTCEWMDKTLGARLLKHLLKSLPRSNGETRKADLSSAAPGSGKRSTTGSNQSQELVSPTEEKQGVKKSFQPQLPSRCSQHESSPPIQILQPRFAHGSVSMGSLDMWRPW
uniref:Orange domain-containing protein n=1 Tax=Varanus komodoensis TaxID=61221 RepID=A0A8D2L449_VARKO